MNEKRRVWAAVVAAWSRQVALSTAPILVVKAAVLTPAAPIPALEFSPSPTVQELFRARVFEEPLVPIGGEPSAAESADLATALRGYAQRSSQDDFDSLTAFLNHHPTSPWRAALLTDLGLEYYNTAHYSQALEAWKEAWSLGKNASTGPAKAIADRAGGELACMYARLGRMGELEGFLKSVEGRVFVGSATEKIQGAREGLWRMQHRPEISFCCGPLALRRIVLSDQRLLTSCPTNALMEICKAPSTQNGFSLSQVAELSRKVGLNYQMAFREKGGEFVVPAVVHWKVGHYAALVRQEHERFLLEDQTFGNTVWATRQALEAETSGYFLTPQGPLPQGWRPVEVKEGGAVWGKGIQGTSDPRPHGPCDPQSGGSNPCDPPCPMPSPPPPSPPAPPSPSPPIGGPQPFQKWDFNAPSVSGMAVSSVHLMSVNLSLRDTPVGYAPPVGPPIRFTVRYNHRDAYQPAIFTYSNFGSKWTCDWISYITDTPSNALADVNFYIRGGGTRTFTGFDTNAQTYAFQQYDQTQLRRTGPASYEMLWPDGSKLVFGQSDGSVGSTRKIFLAQMVDPYGNAVTLSYDTNLRLVAISDAIGQVTALTYGDTNDLYKITQVTDPFGRFASFYYDALGRLTNITDVIGLTSQFSYETNADFINALTTPYGTSSFTRNDSGFARVLETLYPDGSRDRVEFNENLSMPIADPASVVPQGMGSVYDYDLNENNTYYWSRNACATSYGDYTKAKIYKWFVAPDLSGAVSSILNSLKEPLENRVWYDYPGQTNSTYYAGTSSRAQHIGRVLDDGTTQLYTYGYNGFGKLTNSIDPLGRTFSYLYASNGIDLLEVRMTRAGKNELLYRATYNAQHLPLTTTDAAGQTNTYTYNSRGQLLTATDPKNETTSYAYDTNGYLVAVTGPLGTNDVVAATYDMYGRMRTETDLSGYTLTFDYDALDRFTRITHPDSSFEQITYNRLQPSVIQDRAGRQTLLGYDPLGQLTKRTDPLGRVTLFQWCSCGSVKSVTDPMGRTTSWLRDIEDRLIAKQFGDGSQISYTYENTTSRLREVRDEKLQFTSYIYNLDDTLRTLNYANTAKLTPAVSFSYDPDYQRLTSITDGIGTTVYQYVPITAPAVLGAGELASEIGPLPNSTITYSYDELGRRVGTAINGVESMLTYDAAGRMVGATNALGAFTYAYDGSSFRLLLENFPNGQTTRRTYGNNLQDNTLQRLTHQIGATPVSEFVYTWDVSTSRITTWSQQAGAQSPVMYTLGYDAADQLLSATPSQPAATFAYSYDPAGNRLTEQVGTATNLATFNSLNQIGTVNNATGGLRTNEWDAENRMVAVTAGNQRTEFTYDGLGRLASLRQLVNGAEQSRRSFLWCGNVLCEERDPSGAVTKRFFNQGVKLETGSAAGSYYYTRDHLGSVRELTDSAGNVRARYTYDLYGRRTKTGGDVDADFGFAGLFWASEASLCLARYRAYDPELGRWLSRDPLKNAEIRQGPNLYVYAANNPVNLRDRLGLCCEKELKLLTALERLVEEVCNQFITRAAISCENAKTKAQCDMAEGRAEAWCDDTRAKYTPEILQALLDYEQCMTRTCLKPCIPPPQATYESNHPM